MNDRFGRFLVLGDGALGLVLVGAGAYYGFKFPLLLGVLVLTVTAWRVVRYKWATR